MFARRTALALLVFMPWAMTRPTAAAADKPLRQAIDAEIQAGWAKQKIKPASRSDDTTFLRRVYLDLVGVIPSYAETTTFLKDSDPKKREKLIDKLLEDPRFATQQAHVWDLVLFGRRPGNIDATRKREGFTKWLADQFAKNEPYDRWVRNLLTAEQEGSELFYVQYRNQPEEATTAVTRIFLGTQLQCARCQEISHRREEHRRRLVHRLREGAEAGAERRTGSAKVPRRKRARRTCLAQGLQGTGP
jgi:hypothetical protein